MFQELFKRNNAATHMKHASRIMRMHLEAAQAVMNKTGLLTEKPESDDIKNAIALGYFLGKSDGLAYSIDRVLDASIKDITYAVPYATLAAARAGRLSEAVFSLNDTPTALAEREAEDLFKSNPDMWYGNEAEETEGEHTGEETPESAAPSFTPPPGFPPIPGQEDVPQEVAIAEDDETETPAQQQSAA